MQKWRSPHDNEADRYLRKKRNALLFAIFFALCALVIQTFGALYTGSLALLGDTAHVFTDFLSLGMSLVAVILAARPISSVRSFGLFRLEVLASFLNGILLAFVAGGIAWEAFDRFKNPHEVPAVPLIIVALVGLAFNILSAVVLFRSLKGSVEHHHHGHDHNHDDHDDRNLRSAMLHVLSDALGSIAVILGAVMIHFTGYTWVDPAVGLLLAAVIFFWSVRVVRDSGHVLLEGTPRHVDMNELERQIVDFDPRVEAFHDLHVWEITSRMYALSVDLLVQDMTLQDADELRANLDRILHDRFGIAHTAIVVKRAL